MGAAAYGTFAFFDVSLLGTTLELFFLCAAMVVLMRHPESDRHVAVSGLLLGLAALGRPNVLVFAPFVCLWIGLGVASTSPGRQWRRAAFFLVGCVVALAPNTIRNAVVAKDFVPVTSSAGVNLFIGNNPEANGHMTIPPQSGLDVARLYTSSRSVAERELGQPLLKPSQVSGYWRSRATRYMVENPGRTLALMAWKITLFLNHYEIPNVDNKYFVQHRYAPTLKRMVVGFGVVVPLALVGMILSIRRRERWRVAIPYAAFVMLYLISVLPFFVTARYRIAVVPFLIVFAAVGLWRLTTAIRKREFAWVGVVVVIGVASALWVNRTVVQTSYWLSRAAVGKVYVDIARENPDKRADALDLAIVELEKGGGARTQRGGTAPILGRRPFRNWILFDGGSAIRRGPRLSTGQPTGASRA